MNAPEAGKTIERRLENGSLFRSRMVARDSSRDEVFLDQNARQFLEPGAATKLVVALPKFVSLQR